MPRITKPFTDVAKSIGRASEAVHAAAEKKIKGASDKLQTVQDFFNHPPLPKGAMKDLQNLAKAARIRAPFDASKPWNEIHNAHSTNTPAELAAALRGNYDWLEGDIMLEGGARDIPGWTGREPIMAHGTKETLTGMTLKEWLQIGKASGKGLKLDIKQGAAVDEVIAAVKASRVPEDRLIFNADVVGWPKGVEGLQYRAAEVGQDRFANVGDLVKIRKEFPNAMINVGVLSARKLADNPKSYTRAQIDDLKAAAKKVGKPVMFPLRAELLTKEIVKELSAYGHVGVWNWPIDTKISTPAQVAAEQKKFLSWGATGTIDLRPAD